MTILGNAMPGAAVSDVSAVPLLAVDADTAPSYRPIRRWERRYAFGLVLLDGTVALFAAGVAFVLRFGAVTDRSSGYLILSLLLPIAWLSAAGLSRAYEPRFLFVGSEERQRVVAAGVGLIALLAIVSYAGRLEVARGYVLVALPGTTLGVLLVRYVARMWVHRRRRDGRFMQRVLLVGYERGVQRLATQLRREPSHGMDVVGACLPPGWSEGTDVSDLGVPVLGA
ncbi:MAG: nucleoside-diphosphate sugar epimerase/dehydratase, partial [Mycobacteriales bacterium]